MFGNLKNKLGDAADLKKYTTTQVFNSLSSSRQRSNQETPGSQTPTLLQPSHTSTASLQVRGVAGTESHSTSISSESSSPSVSQAKSVNELERENTKLKSALEAQQDASLARLSAKEHEWRVKIKNEQDKVIHLEEKLRETNIRRAQIRTQESSVGHTIAKLEKEVLYYQVRNKELEERLKELQDNYDQIEGLNSQETAKIKHMLLSASTECESLKSELKTKSTALASIENKLTILPSLENRLRLLSQERNQMETRIAGLTHRYDSVNSRWLLKESEHEKEKQQLVETIDALQKRLEETQQQTKPEEPAVNNSISCDNLQHQHQMIKERDELCRKLEETRQQLHNIKTSWSEKICSLETQIQNLNEKMVEDQVELKKYDESSERERLEILSLKKKLKVFDTEDQKQKEKHKLEVSRLAEDLETCRWQLREMTAKRDEVSSKRDEEITHIKEMMAQEMSMTTKFKEELELTKRNFMSLQSQHSEDITELTQLKQLHSSLESKYESVTEIEKKLKDTLYNERLEIKSLKSENESLSNKLETVSHDKSKLSENLDVFLDKTKELEIRCERNKGEIVIKEKIIKGFEEELKERKAEVEKLTKESAEFDSTFESKLEESPLVKNLKDKIEAMEDELADKKQQLKVQKQRIADMKKTIQRELKITEGGEREDEGRGTIANTHPSTHPIVSLQEDSNALKYVVHSPPLQSIPLPPYGSSPPNGCNEFDPVNLSYLKHVILKFVTSREYEAVQLTRAVSTLLHMSSEEETLLRQTLEYKMSWFGSKPNLGTGQTAKAIPPSQ